MYESPLWTFQLFVFVYYYMPWSCFDVKDVSKPCHTICRHYNHVIMSVMASQFISLTIVYSTVYIRRRSKKTSKLRVTGLCEGNSPVTDGFPAQRASNAENVSIWWRHHELWIIPPPNIFDIILELTRVVKIIILPSSYNQHGFYSLIQDT